MSAISGPARFRQLHGEHRPLLLPNAWDFASAAALAKAGHAAIGTTSLGVAAAAGKPDANASTRAETLALARLIGALPVLLTVDIEGGFADDPSDVAELVAELQQSGAVGVNLEDGRPDGTLEPTDLQVAKIQAIKRRVPDVFVNARTDTYWLPGAVSEQLPETLRRGAAYVEAGADGFFVPGVLEAATISSIAQAVSAPLNVLHRPGAFTVEQLAELGVARISTGSLLFRLALHAALTAAAELDPDIAAAAAPPSYQDVQQLIAP